MLQGVSYIVTCPIPGEDTVWAKKYMREGHPAIQCAEAAVTCEGDSLKNSNRYQFAFFGIHGKGNIICPSPYLFADADHAGVYVVEGDDLTLRCGTSNNKKHEAIFEKIGTESFVLKCPSEKYVVIVDEERIAQGVKHRTHILRCIGNTEESATVFKGTERRYP